MGVNKKRQNELKALGFLLQNDKEHFSVRILSKAGNYTTEEMKNINYLADKYGRGYVGVTTRLQLEIPWIKDTDVESFMEEAKKIGHVDYLCQGTIYPDVVESGLGGESAVIKSHHNVGGLPDFVDFKEIIEPLRNLFKDEVRKAGLELGIPEHLVFRQPFPGPGLGIRIIGEVTADKVRIVQDADFIYRSEVDKAVAEYKKANGKAPAWMPNQYFAALTNMRSVGVMGDERTYDYAVALRAVNTIDFMTAESAEIPFEVLQTVMSRIINEVRGVNRVFYDLTSKPPGTIEFE